MLPFLSGPLRALGFVAALSLAACEVPLDAPVDPDEEVIAGVPVSQIVPGYGVIEDAAYVLPPVPPEYLQGVNKRAVVPYRGTAPAGTVEIDPYAKFLYWVQPDGTAIRYPIAVGREGLGISGSFTIERKAEWPGWTPTANMLRREPEIYGPYRNGVPGGLTSPLGARALYLYRGGRDTYFRIHGTNDLSSIGNSGSAGCIRMFNHDVIDLYARVPDGTPVVVRSYDESVRIEGPLMASRGVQLPAFYSGEGQRPPVSQAMVPEEYYGNPGGQAGVAYVPDETDVYRSDGTMIGASAAAGVEMTGGAGFAPAQG
jgi:lipoprotein-anchoring transpeptidase ErfK/SrfK